MSLWRQIAAGFRVLLNRSAADADLDEEVRHYLDESTAAHQARGLSPEDACRAARLDAGSALFVREQVRTAGWENVLATFAADLRCGARRLVAEPAFTIVTVLTLALGIGATTAVLSAVYPILFEPLPYPGADRIVAVWDTAGLGAEVGGSRIDVTFGTYRELVARSRTLEAASVFKPWQPTLTGRAEPERLEGQRVSADYFRVLGVAPTIGRNFAPDDDRINGPNIVILSHELWRRRFDSDPAIVGRALVLEDNTFTVIGVMPRDFENVPAPAAELWAPLQYSESFGPDSREWGHHLRMDARLRTGLRLDQARRELADIARTQRPEFARVPWATLAAGLIVNRLQDDVTGNVRPALVAILGAVLVVLAIACVNVTNLLLARGARRRGEFAMRAALGAGRSRMIRQLLTESLLLAACGGALGLMLAQAGIRALVALSPADLPRSNAIGLDGAVLVTAFAVITIVGLIVGVIPALDASSGDLHAGLQESARGAVGGRHRTRRTLVVAEVALALMLLVSAGLLLRSFERFFGIAPGFDPSHLLTMQVQISSRRFGDDAAHRFFATALDAVRGVPGVAAAGFTSQLPLSGSRDMYGMLFESTPGGPPQQEAGAFRYAVTPGYVDAMRIPLLRGRLLEAHDELPGVPSAVLVSESLARNRFPGRDVIGARLHMGPITSPWSTVVGVVADVKQESLAINNADAVYVTARHWLSFVDRTRWLVVRTRTDPAALIAALRRAVWSVDKDQPIVRAGTMEELVAASAAQRRFALLLFEAFAGIALALTAIGIYGVLSGSVTERTREIGVRTALGASRGQILGLIARQGMTLSGLGAIIGLLGSAATSRAIVTLLFGVSPLDPTTYASVVALLGVVSALACGVPAWRASRVDPAITLRAE